MRSNMSGPEANDKMVYWLLIAILLMCVGSFLLGRVLYRQDGIINALYKDTINLQQETVDQYKEVVRIQDQTIDALHAKQTMSLN
jgi:hypothetical protein